MTKACTVQPSNSVSLTSKILGTRFRKSHSLLLQRSHPTQVELRKESPKSFLMFVVMVLVHKCPSYRLSIPCIDLAASLEDPAAAGGNSKRTGPSNFAGKYSTLSCLIV